MKVLLTKDLKKVGLKGQIVEVADGYGANYVIPSGYGRLFNESAVRDYNAEQERIKELEEQNKKDAEAMAAKLEGLEVIFEAKVGKSGAMIGNVSLKAVSEQLKKQFNITIDKRKFLDHFAINAFGVTKLRIELYKDVVGVISIRVKEKKE